MRRFSCTVKLVLSIKDDTLDEFDVEDLVETALKKLRPIEITFEEDIEEIDFSNDDEELEEGVIEEGYEEFDEDDEDETAN